MEFPTWQARTGHMSRHSSAVEIENCKWCERVLLHSNLSTHEKSCMYNLVNYKECLECNTQLTNAENKFCNSSCAATYNNHITPKRKRTGKYADCLNCNEEFYYLPSRSFGKYCSCKCQQEYQWKQRVIIIESGGIESISKYEPTQRDILKKYLLRKHGEKCMKCGWAEVNKWTGIIPVQLDHIDGNPHNQSLDNLQLLCGSCHSLTEFYGSRGKGRRGMVRPAMMNVKDYLKEYDEN
jgi:hypothetical protein